MKKLFDLQKEYNKKIYQSGSLSDLDMEKITQELALCAHAEISALVSATKYKKHHRRQSSESHDMGRILYESVDVIRYIIAILNLWNVDSSLFTDAFRKKDIYLNCRKDIESNTWSNQPVAIVDMDDVIVDFRKGFSDWLSKFHGAEADVESNEYYFIDALKKKNLNPELTFLDFVDSGGFEMLSPVEGAVDFLRQLKASGYWIQILTARPSENLYCLYDTYSWLSNNSIVFDDISFSTEKFRWCAQSKYYNSNSIAFAIDDSPKHVMDYTKHGIKCYTPEKSYNKEVWNKPGVTTYNSLESFLKKEIKKLV
jgi:hypothetical protein